MRALLLACLASLLLIACGRAPADPSMYRATRVTVTDLAHQPIVDLSTPAELESFNKQWLAKEDTGRTNEGMPIGDFQLFIDVKAQSGGGRWLYSTQGLTAKLDHKAHTLYRLTVPSEFNRVIGAPK